MLPFDRSSSSPPPSSCRVYLFPGLPFCAVPPFAFTARLAPLPAGLLALAAFAAEALAAAPIARRAQGSIASASSWASSGGR